QLPLVHGPRIPDAEKAWRRVAGLFRLEAHVLVAPAESMLLSRIDGHHDELGAGLLTHDRPEDHQCVPILHTPNGPDGPYGRARRRCCHCSGLLARGAEPAAWRRAASAESRDQDEQVPCTDS